MPSSATSLGGVLWGTQALLVQVQVDIRGGLPGLEIIGMADRSVSEAARRVRTALANSGCKLPSRRIVVNLAPADLPKRGTSLDLPIAASIMAATGHSAATGGKRLAYWGQVSLDGAVESSNGELAFALAARDAGMDGVVVSQNASRQAVMAGITVYSVARLADLAAGLLQLAPEVAVGRFSSLEPADAAAAMLGGTDRWLLAIAGLSGPLRCVQIAAAGQHHSLFLGPPGTGKSMLARAIHALLPPLTPAATAEVAAVASAIAGSSAGAGAGSGAGSGSGSGAAAQADLTVRRPLREPAPACSVRALLGGGAIPLPGEATLAHHGLLVLDELGSFRAAALTGLCSVLDHGCVNIATGRGPLSMPARLLLAATSNLCPCGRAGSVGAVCSCSRQARRVFRQRLNYALLDRLSMQVEVSGPEGAELEAAFLTTEEPGAVSSDVLRPRRLMEMRGAVWSARRIQIDRYGTDSCNGQVADLLFRQRAALDPAAVRLAARAGDELGFSARAVAGALRVARTIADLDGVAGVSADHVAEALGYRARVTGMR